MLTAGTYVAVDDAPARSVALFLVITLALIIVVKVGENSYRSLEIGRGVRVYIRGLLLDLDVIFAH